MAPAKFDDFSKTAKDVLAEDYATKGVGVKSKHATKFEGLTDIMGGGDGKSGATITTAIDLNLGAKCATPAKLTWKFPKPLGVAGLCFDKLEMDKAGALKLEASVDKALHGLADFKIECKSDLKSADGVSVGATYTGIANALCKAEIKPTDPANYTAEASYAVGGGATVGVRSSKTSVADVGVQYAHGPMFFSASTKDTFSAFTFHNYYKASGDLKLASTYNSGGKANGEFAAGLAYALAPGMNLKGKLTGMCDLSAMQPKGLAVSASIKRELSKGVTVHAGANYSLDNKPFTWGMQINIE